MANQKKDTQRRVLERLGMPFPMVERMKELENENKNLRQQIAEQSDALVELAEMIARRDDRD